MLLFDGAFGLFVLALWIFCIIDVITTPDGAVRNLPRLLWLVIVILLPDVGSIVWLVAGHPWGPRSDVAAKGSRGRGVAAGPRRMSQASNPDDDEEFLAGLRARAAEQRRRARPQQDEQPPTE